jgi:deoxyribonuclease IV
MIKIGPSGIGPVKEIEKTFENYKHLGIKCAEIPFTYGIYIKNKKVAEMIKKFSEKFNIGLSIHAPYWINLNSEEWEKVEASKKRILNSCEVANWIGAKKVVFHCGFFGKRKKEDTYENIKNQINEIQKEIKKNNWGVKLCPETMGKINVFGSTEEIARLVHSTNCSFCLDLAHILARDKKISWEKLDKLFPQKDWHCHFSGIEFGEKGEKYHKKTEKKYWRWLFKNLPRNKNITIINEAPTPIEDSIEGLSILKDNLIHSLSVTNT